MAGFTAPNLQLPPNSSENDTFSDDAAGDWTNPGERGGSGLYNDVCLCSNNSFLGLRSCDCSLIVLSIRLLYRGVGQWVQVGGKEREREKKRRRNFEKKVVE
jgi:hypothetical protein